MNLEESDAFKEELEKNSRHKKNVMISIIVCVLVLIILIALIVYIQYKDSVTLKLFIDDKQYKIPENFFYIDNGKKYISIKDLAELLGYEYTRGIYEQANENEDSGYFDTGFETVSVTAGDKKFTKYITLEGTGMINEITVSTKAQYGYSETFRMDEPLTFENEKIYISEDYLTKMFNLGCDWKEYRIRLYTLANTINYYQEQISKLGYTEVSGYYENFRAMLDGYVIVGNGSQLYGVYSIKDGKEIISMKYDDIRYVQNTEEFYIVASDGTMGLMDNSGKFVIDAGEYDSISLLDEENMLYLVEKNHEYGVLNKDGDIIIYAENDKIGYDVSNYTLEKLDNELLWFDKCIPVLKDGKYGLYNKNGENELLLPKEPPLTYEGFGYLSTASSKTSGNEQSVLIIPGSVGIEGIVLKYNDMYGVYDINEERIVLTCVFDKIYAITKSGKTTYYIDYHGNQYVLSDYLEENNLKNIDSNGKYINAPDYSVDSENSDNQDSKVNLQGNENSNITILDDGASLNSSTNSSIEVVDDTRVNNTLEEQNLLNQTETQNIVAE